jgi:hypothetical protein
MTFFITEKLYYGLDFIYTYENFLPETWHKSLF